MTDFCETWAFKIRLQQSNRNFQLCLETKKKTCLHGKRTLIKAMAISNGLGGMNPLFSDSLRYHIILHQVEYVKLRVTAKPCTNSKFMYSVLSWVVHCIYPRIDKWNIIYHMMYVIKHLSPCLAVSLVYGRVNYQSVMFW